MEEILKKVRDFADDAHGEQKRKYTGEPYIVHPERVMKICREYVSDLPVLAAALLHDVLEDTPVTRDDLRKSLLEIMNPSQAETTTDLVTDLTDVYIKEDYPGLNRHKRKQRESERLGKAHPDAQTIKYADIIDNATDITKNDKDFARRFVTECQGLLEKMKNGNQDLYQRASDVLEQCQKDIKATKR